MNLKKLGHIDFILVFNSFSNDNLIMRLSIAFRPSNTYLLFPGAPNALSLRIEKYKVIHDSR